MSNNTSRTSSRIKRRTRKGSIVKFSFLGAFILIMALLSVISFDVPWVSNGIYRFNSFASNINVGVDLRGGVYGLFEADEETTANLSERMDDTRSRVHSMLVDRGYTDANVTREGRNRLRVEVSDVNSPQELFNTIGRPTDVVFRDPDGRDIIQGDQHIVGVNIVSSGGVFGVVIRTNSTGRSRLANSTTNTGEYNLVLVVDGEEQASPITLSSAITNGEISLSSTSWTRSNAQSFADQVIVGSFSVDFNMISTDVIAPTLGESALSLFIIAGLIGLLLVMAYMIFVYRLMGVVASISLLLFGVLLLFGLYFVPWVQLSLAGMAGLLVSVGLAVEANIIVAERIKDEYRKGKSLNASINLGFGRAIFAILDVSIISVVVAILLMTIGTGSLYAFGIVLLIGVFVSVFSCVLMSRLMLKWTMAITGDIPSKQYGLDRPEGVQLIPDEEKTKPKTPKEEVIFDGVV